MTDFDPIQVEVWRHLLAAIAEEMGATLERTAYSPNIKERLDHSCALFDSEGRLLSQAAHIPVHLGAMPLMLQSLRKSVSFEPGVMWLCNDPRLGGTHLPDLTLVAPVYVNEADTLLDGREASPIGFVANRAHHADIGGIAPGSLPLSREIFQEGLILPPMKLVRNHRVQEEVIRLVCANSRTPAERRGDLSAQIAANETGIRRFEKLYRQFGKDEFQRRTGENLAHCESMVRSVLSELPPGVYSAEDLLDSDGAGTSNVRIQVKITVAPQGEIEFDFSCSDGQVPGSLNATEAITLSACCYVVRCLASEEMPTNQGCFAPIRVIASEGSVVNARFPAAVAGGNVETSQRIVDVLLLALAGAVPDKIPAASQGTMNNITIGGYDPIRKRPFAYYETSGGGSGASSQGNGASALHTHMTNTRNTPVESLEAHYPLQVMEISIAEGTGGQGRFCGGEGMLRRIAFLAEAQTSLLTERRDHPPYGLEGGSEGSCGRNTLQFVTGKAETLPAKWNGICPAGSVISIQTPGGGGWGVAESVHPGEDPQLSMP